MKFPKYFYFKIKVINHGCGIEVEDASDLDVVEVVRCKDCKYSSPMIFAVMERGQKHECKSSQTENI